MGDVNTMLPFSLIKHIPREVCSPRGRITQTTCLIYTSSSLFIPFTAKEFPIDESNRLALDRVKSISALSAYSAVKGLMGTFDAVNRSFRKRRPLLLLIHRCSHFTLFDDVAQAHQALDFPAASGQALEGDQPAQQENPDLGNKFKSVVSQPSESDKQ